MVRIRSALVPAVNERMIPDATIVIVTHDAQVAAQADSIVHVRDGRLESAEIAPTRRAAPAARAGPPAHCAARCREAGAPW